MSFKIVLVRAFAAMLVSLAAFAAEQSQPTLAAPPAAQRSSEMTTTTKSPASTQEDLLAKNDAEFAAGFEKLYSQTWGEGAIPAKYKELNGVSLSVVIRCEGCLLYHIKTVAKIGATGKEVIEAMRIGLLSGGSITIPTVRVGYKLLQELGLI